MVDSHHAPTALLIPTVRNADSASVEKLAENYALSVFRKKVAAQPNSRSTSSARRAVPTPARIVVPNDSRRRGLSGRRASFDRFTCSIAQLSHWLSVGAQWLPPGLTATVYGGVTLAGI